MVATNQKTQYTNFYNPKDVFLFVNNVEINAFAEGEMVSIAMGNDRQTMSVDAKGTAFFVGNNDRRATSTVNLSEMSVDNAMINKLLSAGTPFPFKLVHQKESWSGQALVQKAPDGKFGNTASGRTWNFLIGNCDYQNDNV